jgi:hypothetical protein
MTTATFATLEEYPPSPALAGIRRQSGRGPHHRDARRLRPLHDRQISSRDTSGAFAVIEDITPPLSGPPLHIHYQQDEWIVRDMFQTRNPLLDLLALPCCGHGQ